MRKLLIAFAIATFAATGAYAAGGSTVTPQQRMKECAPLTKGMSKTERSSFMKECLSKKGHDAAMASKGKMSSAESSAKSKAGDARAAQRQKMKDCNASAKTKKLQGAERKSFMKSCLKGG